MAQSRKRAARAEAEAYFTTLDQIKKNSAERAAMLEYYSDVAASQNTIAESCGTPHIRFVGAREGVLAVQALADPLRLPASWTLEPRQLFKELQHDPNDPQASDPRVTAAVVDVLTRNDLGVSYRRRQNNEECRALLRGPVRLISLFVEDREWVGQPVSGLWDLPYWSCPTSDEWDGIDDRDLRGRGFPSGDNGVGELLGGGGFQIFDGDKGHP